MPISKEAEENRPKKAANTYFLFMTKRSHELGDTKNKRDIITKEYR
jgi:hypothetical protein